MNEGRPYLQMWRGVWVSFCKIAIVSFLSVRYRSDGLYCRMAGTRSSPTMLFIRVGIKDRVGDDGGPAILQCRSSNLYLTDRKENMAIYPHSSPHLQIRPSSFILFSHKILMFRATHGHLASLVKNRVGDDGVPGILQYSRPIYIWWIGRKLWQFCKKIPTPSPHLQIRPSLVHPFLSQDKLVIQMHLDVTCNARASC